MSGVRILRDRQENSRRMLDAAEAGVEARGSSAMLAQTTAVKAYPTNAEAFYAVVPCDIDGSENEGASVSFVPRAGAIAYALNLGAQVPPSGTTVVCHGVGGRWCFRYG